MPSAIRSSSFPRVIGMLVLWVSAQGKLLSLVIMDDNRTFLHPSTLSPSRQRNSPPIKNLLIFQTFFQPLLMMLSLVSRFPPSNR